MPRRVADDTDGDTGYAGRRMESHRSLAGSHFLLALAVCTSLVACNGEATNVVTGVGPGGPPAVAPARRVVGVAELTLRNVTSTGMSASILLATSVAQLEQLRQVQGSAGNFGSIQLQILATGQFTDSLPGSTKTRFLR